MFLGTSDFPLNTEVNFVVSDRPPCLLLLNCLVKIATTVSIMAKNKITVQGSPLSRCLELYIYAENGVEFRGQFPDVYHLNLRFSHLIPNNTVQMPNLREIVVKHSNPPIVTQATFQQMPGCVPMDLFIENASNSARQAYIQLEMATGIRCVFI
jgi:hypothetical protein